MIKSDTHIRNSILTPVSKQEVIEEYEFASRLRTPYERAVWGSTASMMGRFRFALSVLPFDRIRTWLDAGCGEADFFALAEENGHRFQRLAGVDITPAMIRRARVKTLVSPAEFLVADLEMLPEKLTGFNLITLIGVLQKCGVTPERVFESLAERLRPDGQIFLTSKNLLWSQFRDGFLQPEAGHSWFDPHEVAAAAAQSGLATARIGGLIPSEAREVALGESHSFFLILRAVG